jgi:WD40 repeat protein
MLRWRVIAFLVWGFAFVIAASGQAPADSASVLVWRLDSPQPVAMSTLRSRGVPIRTLAFSPDGRLLATGAEDGGVEVWEATAGKLLHSFPPNDYAINALAFSPDGKLLVAGGADRAIGSR